MTDTKISAATSIAPPLATDMLPLARVGDTVARKITVGNLRGGVFNVKDYGAVGDGVTDDKAAIQAAITAATAAATNGRATVYTPPGIYRINTPISLASNINYDFQNGTFQPGAGCSGLSMFLASGISHFSIIGGNYIKGPYAATIVQGGVTYTNHVCFHISGGCQYFEISGCYFSGFFGDINVYDSSDGVVENNSSYLSNAGIAVVATTQITTRIRILFNIIRSGGDDGVALLAHSNFDVSDCWVIGNAIDKTGLVAAAAVGIRSGNTVAGTGVCRRLSILSNTLTNMTAHALYLYDLYDSNVSFNLVNGYGLLSNGAVYLGLSAAHPVVNLKFIGNQIVNPTAGKGLGIYCSALSLSEIGGNRVDSNFGSIGSISLDTGSTGVNIHDNKLFNAAAGAGPAILSSDTSDYMTIYDNDLRGGVGVPISVVGSNNRIARNLGFVSEKSGLSAAIASGGTIAHGLNGTPNFVSVTAATAGATDVTVTVDTTNITVTYGGGGTKAFYWRALLAESQ